MIEPKDINVLIACEESQAVCLAFRERGFNAFSCDILDCSGGHPEWHIKDDVKRYLWKGWDLIIAHPPCDYLTVSNNNAMEYGCKKYSAEQARELRKKAIKFFMLFVEAPIKHVCIENPIGVMSTKYRKPDQIIQPWQFGHGETKSTCLWLKNLPKLKPTNIVEGREQKIWRMPPSKDRAKLRSKTFLGMEIAK